MVLRTALVALAGLLALTNCSRTALPAAPPATGAAPVAAPNGAAPAENATGLPGENATGLPGENATGLPGENATGLPGADFACAPVLQQGQARCTLEIRTGTPTADPSTPAALVPGLHPSDLRDAYAFPAGGAGATVAIVDAYDDPTAESDLAVYRSTFGLPACSTSNGCFRKVDQRGTASFPAFDGGWANEISLDIEMVSAVCPACRIVLVEADSASLDDLGAAEDRAASFAPLAIGNSYYASEWSTEAVEDPHYRHPGIAVVASSGDAPDAFYPAASPSVTAVGGTTLARGAGGWSETAWSHGGRGCSAYESRPHWQHAAPCSTRAAVDMAVVADPSTGVATFSSSAGGWIVAGGTSVGAPVIAAAYALAGSGEGPWYAYAHPSGFAPVGASPYDLATGLGAPRGLAGL